MQLLAHMPFKKTWSVIGVGAAAIVSLIGCSSPSNISPKPRDSAGTTEQPTSSFWLIADPQLHNPAGAGTRSKGGTMDAFATKAIRPPSIDLWSEVVLDDIVNKMNAQPAPVFFLGDAANVSCIGEFSRFLKAVSPAPWFGVPGNHDGYYMGNMALRPDAVIEPSKDTWQGACQYSTALGASSLDGIQQLERHFIEDLDDKGGLTHVKQGTLTKTHAIWMYLDDLSTRIGQPGDVTEISHWRPSEDGQWYRYSLEGKLSFKGVDLKVSARALIAKLGTEEVAKEKSRAWQASLVQDVTLPDGVHALLIDTSDYARTPPTSAWQFRGLLGALFKGCGERDGKLLFPGSCGEVEAGQMKEIEELICQWPKGTRFFVLGHHPWNSLSKSSRRLLKSLRGRPGFMNYISGHTHITASTRMTDAAQPWEINVGSTTDWPMEYSRLHYWPAGSGGAGTPLRLELSYAESTGQCPYANEKRAQSEIDYGTTEKYVSTALHAYEGLLENLVRRQGDRLGDLPKWIQKIQASRRRCTALRASNDRLPIRQPGWQRNPPAVRLELDQCIDDQRALLAQLMELDRNSLRAFPQARQIETACAIWASAVECAKHECSSMKVRDIGGSQQRAFAFRIPEGLFAEDRAAPPLTCPAPIARHSD